MNFSIVIHIIIVILFSSCSNTSNSFLDDSLILGKTITIHCQDTLKNNEELIWIAFDSLLEDSRCPVDVVCVWQGNAKLLFSFAKASFKTTFSLNTFGQFKEDTTLFGYNISLVDVKPYRHSEKSYVQDDYSAFIIVSN